MKCIAELRRTLLLAELVPVLQSCTVRLYCTQGTAVRIFEDTFMGIALPPLPSPDYPFPNPLMAP